MQWDVWHACVSHLGAAYRPQGDSRAGERICEANSSPNKKLKKGVLGVNWDNSHFVQGRERQIAQNRELKAYDDRQRYTELKGRDESQLTAEEAKDLAKLEKRSGEFEAAIRAEVAQGYTASSSFEAMNLVDKRRYIENMGERAARGELSAEEKAEYEKCRLMYAPANVREAAHGHMIMKNEADAKERQDELDTRAREQAVLNGYVAEKGVDGGLAQLRADRANDAAVKAENDAYTKTLIDADAAKLIDEMKNPGYDNAAYQAYLQKQAGPMGYLPPGMTPEDYRRFQFASGKVDEQMALDKVDGDALLALRAEERTRGEEPKDQDMREHVLGNIAESQRAREASNFGDYAAKEAEVAQRIQDVNSKPMWDSWQNCDKITQNGQVYAKIGNRLYTKHAVDRMQPSGNRFGVNIEQAGGDHGRSVAPQFIEDVIASSKPDYQPINDTYRHVSGSLKVILNSKGAVVTVITMK